MLRVVFSSSLTTRSVVLRSRSIVLPDSSRFDFSVSASPCSLPPVAAQARNTDKTYDLVIYGGTSAGVALSLTRDWLTTARRCHIISPKRRDDFIRELEAAIHAERRRAA